MGPKSLSSCSEVADVCRRPTQSSRSPTKTCRRKCNRGPLIISRVLGPITYTMIIVTNSQNSIGNYLGPHILQKKMYSCAYMTWLRGPYRELVHYNSYKNDQRIPLLIGMGIWDSQHRNESLTIGIRLWDSLVPASVARKRMHQTSHAAGPTQWCCQCAKSFWVAVVCSDVSTGLWSNQGEKKL